MDCGDEAAQTVMNCIIDNWWINEAITCEEDKFRKYKDAKGWWSITTNVHGRLVKILFLGVMDKDSQ